MTQESPGCVSGIPFNLESAAFGTQPSEPLISRSYVRHVMWEKASKKNGISRMPAWRALSMKAKKRKCVGPIELEMMSVSTKNSLRCSMLLCQRPYDYEYSCIIDHPSHDGRCAAPPGLARDGCCAT